MALGSGHYVHAVGFAPWPAGLVAPVAGFGAAGLAAGEQPTWGTRGLAAGRPVGLVIQHGLAGWHLLVDLCRHAHLWRLARLPGGAGGARAGRAAGFVLRRSLWTICGASHRQQDVGSYYFCSALVAGRVGARYLADRFWLGCGRLCPCGRAAGRLCAVAGCLRLVRHRRVAGHDRGGSGSHRAGVLLAPPGGDPGRRAAGTGLANDLPDERACPVDVHRTSGRDAAAGQHTPGREIRGRLRCAAGLTVVCRAIADEPQFARDRA